MKNIYMSVEQYEKFLKLFEFSDEDKGRLSGVIWSVRRIMELKAETPQDNSKLYLKPIMTANDYKIIDKALRTQLEFKVNRELKILEDNLKKEGISEEEIIEKRLDNINNLREKYGLNKQNKNKIKKKGTALTLEMLEEL